ncbi:MAG: transcription antitermination factor NusB [Ignavibacteria bacterium]|nr:transcription antitermination factor NusB [Ignavibacteria bacterium]
MSQKRRIVRERVLQALYAYELSREPIEFVVQQILSDLNGQPTMTDFAKRLIMKVVGTSDELDAIIRERVANWEFNRLAILDRIILRMAICELLYFEDIPPKVSINEAIEIARRFSTEKSDKFVNGVLDSVLEDLREGGRLKKTGRGLLETSAKKNSPA